MSRLWFYYKLQQFLQLLKANEASIECHLCRKSLAEVKKARKLPFSIILGRAKSTIFVLGFWQKIFISSKQISFHNKIQAQPCHKGQFFSILQVHRSSYSHFFTTILQPCVFALLHAEMHCGKICKFCAGNAASPAILILYKRQEPPLSSAIISCLQHSSVDQTFKKCSGSSVNLPLFEPQGPLLLESVTKTRVENCRKYR